MAFKLNFLREKKDAAQERKVESEDRSRLPLEKAAELYFNWKHADISPRTIAREKRLFKSVEKFIGGKRTVRSIDLQLLEEYQEERRKQIGTDLPKPSTSKAFLWKCCAARRPRHRTGRVRLLLKSMASEIPRGRLSIAWSSRAAG
jgi:hypothetical protein